MSADLPDFVRPDEEALWRIGAMELVLAFSLDRYAGSEVPPGLAYSVVLHKHPIPAPASIKASESERHVGSFSERQVRTILNKYTSTRWASFANVPLRFTAILERR